MILITQSLKELQQVMSDYVGIVRTNSEVGQGRCGDLTCYRKKRNNYTKALQYLLNCVKYET